MLQVILDDILRWLVPAVLGAGATGFGFAWKWGRGLAKGMRVLLRARLIDLHERYVEQGKPCPVDVKDEADEVYSAYHSMGGNGTGTHLHEEIMDAHIAGQ